MEKTGRERVTPKAKGWDDRTDQIYSTCAGRCIRPREAGADDGGSQAEWMAPSGAYKSFEGTRINMVRAVCASATLGGCLSWWDPSLGSKSLAASRSQFPGDIVSHPGLPLPERTRDTSSHFLCRTGGFFFPMFARVKPEKKRLIGIDRQANPLLGDILLDRSNSAVMTRYVSSRDNLRILMNLLRESSKSIQIEAFHVFKLFAANQNKPPDIVSILVANRSKLLRLFADFKTDKEDEQFEADKAQVVKEIAALEPKELP
nr:putative MO25-like protein At5g47540 [Ipomoea batatas]